MLSYLSSTSRTDASFAAYHCARFSSNPKKCHEEAVKRIGRHLKRTQDFGMTCKFDVTKVIGVHADADLSGSWFNFNSHQLVSALSQTGYVIKFANCPACWVSNFQTEVALSTTEAEYISLSQSTRDLLLIKNTL